MSGDTLTYRGRLVFATTPRALLRDPSISASAKALWALIDDHASPDHPVPWPGQDRLAEFMGVTSRTIRSWLKELVDAGWIVCRRTGRSNRYELVDELPSPRPDRKQASDRDRKQASDQSGSRVPGKKNQEEEPGEEGFKSSSPSQRGRPQAPAGVPPSGHVVTAGTLLDQVGLGGDASRVAPAVHRAVRKGWSAEQLVSWASGLSAGSVRSVEPWLCAALDALSDPAHDGRRAGWRTELRACLGYRSDWQRDPDNWLKPLPSSPPEGISQASWSAFTASEMTKLLKTGTTQDVEQLFRRLLSQVLA